jgi:hypothetical protein
MVQGAGKRLICLGMASRPPGLMLEARTAQRRDLSKGLCSVGKTEKKEFRAKSLTRKNHSPASLACYAQTSPRGVQVSTSALIKMLIICAAMLTIQLLAYFAYQPVWPH